MSGESDVTITTSANTLTLKKSNADNILLRLSDDSAKNIIAIGTDASGNPNAEGGISIGYNSYIDANNNVAIGTNSKCKAGNSVAIGNNAQSDQQSVAIGHDSDAGFGGTSVGSGTSIGSGAKSGYLSASYGLNTQATGEKCVAISGDALANNTVAVGYDAYCNGVNSMALGYNAGTGDYTNSISIGANSSVGANDVISLGDGTQKVGIGTTNPSQKLHVNAGNILAYDNSHGVELGYHEIKMTRSGAAHYSIWNYGGTLRINNTSINSNTGYEGTSLISITSSGDLGVGTHSPQTYAKFAVRGHRWTNRGSDYWGGLYDNGNHYGMGGNSTNQDYSGYFQKAIYCNQLHTASDRRIKKNIIDINDDDALQKLRLLKPKSYNYINEYQRGSETVFGFIAQEVSEVFPESVNIIKEHIPNIYEVGEVLQDNSGALTIIQFSNFNTNDILRDASNNIYSNLEIVGEDDKSCELEIVSIIDDSKIQINTDLSNNCLITDDNKKLVFVNGQQVDDFNNLNKSSIWTVTTSALQEVDRQLQAEKTKVSTLESQVADLLIRVASLENV
jgi:hypothetical protein